MTNDTQAPETIWATTAREGYDTLHSEWPPNEWPKEEHPFDYEPQEYILKSTSDARIAELEAALREYMEHDADYARLNNLGDHTQSHRWKRAIAALGKE